MKGAVRQIIKKETLLGFLFGGYGFYLFTAGQTYVFFEFFIIQRYVHSAHSVRLDYVIPPFFSVFCVFSS